MTGIWADRLVWAAAAAVAISVGIAAGPLPWRFMGESGLPAPPAPARLPEAAPVALDAILALMPFGRAAAPEAPVTSEETGFVLTLHGVVISAASSGSAAIISEEGEPARIYSVGQEVTDGAVLVEVLADHVVLAAGGHRETLSFPERKAEPSGTGSASTPAAGSGLAALRALVTAQSSGEEAKPEEPDAVAESAASDVGSDPEAIISKWRGRVQTNPRGVLDGLGLVAGAVGYIVAPSASEALRSAGLQPGDVITKVNGQQVGAIEADQRLFEEVVASGRARLEIIREGQTVVMSFPLR